MSGARTTRRGAGENFYVSLNDVLVGVLFLFILLLMAFALNYRQREARLMQGKEAIERVYRERFDRRAALLERLEASLKARGFQAEAVPADGILRLGGDLLFETKEAVPTQRGRAALALLGREMARRLPCAATGGTGCDGRPPILEAVYIEGHTDRIPINSPRFPSNWELSSKRAIVTYDAIMAAGPALRTMRNARGRENLVGVSAYAETRAISRALAPNRRVDFRFILAAPTQREIERAIRGEVTTGATAGRRG